jgi:hypothetical protein
LIDAPAFATTIPSPWRGQGGCARGRFLVEYPRELSSLPQTARQPAARPAGFFMRAGPDEEGASSVRKFSPFTSNDEIAAIGLGLIGRTLPKPQWTHAAHFAAALWMIACRPDLVAERDMPGIIRAYNEATGVMNTDHAGYHETITQASLRAARA